jgi:transcriptional regulator with XRE-family HTH domain
MDASTIPLTPLCYPHHTLKEARQNKRLTQRQIADECGITLRQYQRLESGQRSLSGTSFRVGMALCELLDIDPHRLLESTE